MFDDITGDPLHSRAACTQPCNVNTHSRAHCSPGARLCEQCWHGCVNNGARLCASARLCRGPPVDMVNGRRRQCIMGNQKYSYRNVTWSNQKNNLRPILLPRLLMASQGLWLVCLPEVVVDAVPKPVVAWCCCRWRSMGRGRRGCLMLSTVC